MSVLSAEEVLEKLTNPERIYSYSDFFSSNSVPRTSGVYAWYFTGMPAFVPIKGCIENGKRNLLYVGKSGSSGLYSRIKKHYDGTARYSTLRMSLGVLLHEQMPTPLHRVNPTPDKHYCFPKEGEKYLNDWMEKNAFVCWSEHQNPKSVEDYIIAKVSPPFNIKDGTHSFSNILTGMRSKAKREAKNLPILDKPIRGNA